MSNSAKKSLSIYQKTKVIGQKKVTFPVLLLLPTFPNVTIEWETVLHLSLIDNYRFYSDFAASDLQGIYVCLLFISFFF